MKIILTLTIIATIGLTAFSQDVQKVEIKNQAQTYSYAYISMEAILSKKLIVEVDFGDTPEQIIAGKEYSKILTGKKSCAAVLNYMAERQFEFVESHDLILKSASTSTPYGFIVLMRKKNN